METIHQPQAARLPYSRKYFAVVLMAAVLISYGGSVAFVQANQEMQRQVLFDANWKFHLGEELGASKPDFPDGSWRILDVPHDFSIEGVPGANPKAMDGPFDQYSPAGFDGGFLNAGIAWYRKSFTLPGEAKNKCVSIQFDGVYMDSSVYLNGVFLGNHPYGYTSFSYNLTPYLRKDGGPNTLAVRVNVAQPCSRWYSGAGIFRHVWLVVTQPVYVGKWKTYIRTPEIANGVASVRIQTCIVNDSAENANVTAKTAIIGPDGKEVANSKTSHVVKKEESSELDDMLHVIAPQLWSPDNPSLYKTVTQLEVDGIVVDEYVTPFGIRTIQFTADNGFLLNGKRVPIKGVCNHHDLGCLGAIVNKRGIERQLEILKSIGCNAIRTSHNPPAPELLELCDKMGFLVMDECFDEWEKSKKANGYGRFFANYSENDLCNMIQRDRNHPSVVLWSIGNEIPEQSAPNGEAMAKRLADIARREDPTRPITAACNSPEAALKTGFAKALDVFGINYNIGWYKKAQGHILLASETASIVSSRGVYSLFPGVSGTLEIKSRDHFQCSSYETDDWVNGELLKFQFPGKPMPHAGATGVETSLTALDDCPWVAGQFVWTGFDYIGEPSPFIGPRQNWPARSSYFGMFDLCGFPKDRAFLYQSRWSTNPMVHLFPHWNWDGFEGKEIPVRCYTNAQSVELFLNGRSLGEHAWKDTTALHFEWRVPYTPGVLKAVARNGGRIVATDEIFTAGKPAKIILSPDRSQLMATGEDLSFVKVQVVDKNGHLCPNADNQIEFALTGPAVIAGVDNGDATNHQPFQGSEHKVFHGLGLVVVKTTKNSGQIRLSATTAGLETQQIELTAAPDPTASISR